MIMVPSTTTQQIDQLENNELTSTTRHDSIHFPFVSFYSFIYSIVGLLGVRCRLHCCCWRRYCCFAIYCWMLKIQWRTEVMLENWSIGLGLMVVHLVYLFWLSTKMKKKKKSRKLWSRPLRTIDKLGSLCVVAIDSGGGGGDGGGRIVKCEVLYFMSVGLDCAVIANPFHGLLGVCACVCMGLHVMAMSFIYNPPPLSYSLLNANIACKMCTKSFSFLFYSFFFIRFDCVIHNLLLFHRLINQKIEWALCWMWKTHRIPQNAWNPFSTPFTIHFWVFFPFTLAFRSFSVSLFIRSKEEDRFFSMLFSFCCFYATSEQEQERAQCSLIWWLVTTVSKERQPASQIHTHSKPGS